MAQNTVNYLSQNYEQAKIQIYNFINLKSADDYYTDDEFDEAKEIVIDTFEYAYSLGVDINLPLLTVDSMVDYIFSSSKYDFDITHPEVNELNNSFMRNFLIDIMDCDDNILVNEFDENQEFVDALYKSFHFLTNFNAGFHSNDSFDGNCILMNIIMYHYDVLHYLFVEKQFTFHQFIELINTIDEDNEIIYEELSDTINGVNILYRNHWREYARQYINNSFIRR